MSEAKKATHVGGGREDKRGESGLWCLTVLICRCEGFPRDDQIQDVTMGNNHCGKMEKKFKGAER